MDLIGDIMEQGVSFVDSYEYSWNNREFMF